MIGNTWRPVMVCPGSMWATAWPPGPSCLVRIARCASADASIFAARVLSSVSSCRGVFPEYAVLPEIALVKVADNISDSEAACLQSLSDSVAAVEAAQIGIGDTVAIFGQGSMGLECLQIARNSGAGLLITVDVREEACRMSRELGADVALNATQCDPVSIIRDLTKGNGADIVFECAVGAPNKAWPATRRS